MSSDGSVTRLLDPLQRGDPAAVQQLWQRYFHRLVALARKKLLGARHLGADEEDVALSAFDSFCRNAERGRFPDLADRDELWGLLVVLTARKAGHLRREQARLKRGRLVDVGEEGQRLLQEALGREPDPALAAVADDEHRRLMAGLRDDELRAVAQKRLEGASIEEIAAQLRFVPRSIKRKLRLIRSIRERELTS
jgi:DNA-directed RNA polymerase specialized sigma24 family protein